MVLFHLDEAGTLLCNILQTSWTLNFQVSPPPTSLQESENCRYMTPHMAFYGLDSGHQASAVRTLHTEPYCWLSDFTQKVIFKSQILSVLFLSCFYMTSLGLRSTFSRRNLKAKLPVYNSDTKE